MYINVSFTDIFFISIHIFYWSDIVNKNEFKKPKIKDGLREIKKGFLKDVDLEPSIKLEISKDFNHNKKKNIK